MTEKKGGCCSDELKFFKIEDSHKNSSKIFHEYHFSAIALQNDYRQINSEIEFLNFTAIKSLPNPDIASPPIYISNCLFRL